jgi:hypothetical protein
MQTVESIVRLPYELLPWQLTVKRDPHRFITIPAGRRSGKTHLLCDLLVEAALTYAQGLPCWYVAPTYGMAKDIAWSLLKDLTEDLYRAGLITRYYETDLKIDFVNGASIHLKGAENLDSLRGRGLGFLGLDEIALMHRDVWLKVLYPATSDHNARVVFIGTPKGYNYFWELCEMEKADPEHWKKFHIKTSEAGTLSAAIIAQAQRDLDPQSFRQEYEASFETFAGQIFHWEEGELPALSWDETWYGGDFGYSVDPAAVVKIYRKADELWVEEVLYQKGLTNPMLAAAMKSRGVNGQVTYFDAAEPKSIEELRRAGLHVQPCDKGPDSVRAGIDFLKSKKITIVRGSENLLREHRSYCWRTSKDGADMPEPMKVDDHLMDAARYGIFTHMNHTGPRIWTA